MVARQLTNEQKAQIAQAMYVGAVPFVDKSYQSDPRTQLANAMMAQGSDFTPVQGGWTEGIARALSGVAGGYVGRQQRDKARIADNYWAGKVNTANAPVAAGLAKAGGVQPPPVSPTGAAPPMQAAPGNGQVLPDPRQAMVARAFQQGAPAAPALSANPPQPGLTPVSRPSTQLPASPPIPVPASPRVLTPGEPAGVSRRAAARANTGYENYQSSAYDALEEKYAAQYGIPVNLIRSIRLAGEKSNASAVSPVGARSVYQFTPETRRLFMDRHGFDPWSSPENAVKAAAIHLAGDWQRSGGDPAETAASYIAGPSGRGRGRVTRAYVNRVMAAYNGGEAPGPVNSNVSVAPELMDVPELPAAPLKPDRPVLGDRVRSARLQVASRLLSDNMDPEDAAGIYALTQPLLEQGYTEDQASQLQRDENESQLTNQQYSSDLQGYQQALGDIRGAQIADRARADAANIAAQAAATQQEYEGINRRAEANNARTQARIEGEIANQRDPAFVAKEVYQQRSILQDANTALSEIDKYPNATGPQFHLGVELSQYQDQPGVEARAAIQNLAGYLLNKRSGAAVTPEEFRRNAAWLPNITDRPETVRKKVNAIIAQANGRLSILGAGAPVAAASMPTGQGPVANTGLPPGVTVEVVP